MQHQQATFMHGGIHRTCNAIPSGHAHFPQLVFQWPDVWLADMLGSKGLEQFRDPHKPGLQVGCQSLQLSFSQGVNQNRPGWRNYSHLAICWSRPSHGSSPHQPLKQAPWQTLDLSGQFQVQQFCL